MNKQASMIIFVDSHKHSQEPGATAFGVKCRIKLSGWICLCLFSPVRLLFFSSLHEYNLLLVMEKMEVSLKPQCCGRFRPN